MKNQQSSNHKTLFKLIIYSKEPSCKRLRQTHHFRTQKNSTIIIKTHSCNKKNLAVYILIYLFIPLFQDSMSLFLKKVKILYSQQRPQRLVYNFACRRATVLVITTREESFLKFEEVLDFLLLENSATCIITAVLLRRIR